MDFDAIVAMSGGVDSTCTAYLLQRSGLRIMGITLRMFDHDTADSAVHDAGEAAALLGIPHRTIDVRDLFLKHVVEPFRVSYLSGITPSPCLVCNPLIKWIGLLAHVANSPQTKIATGHYASIGTDATGRTSIFRGTHLDQSYFLSRLPSEFVNRTLLPLGLFPKSDVRNTLKQAGLPLFDRPDSQENCFISSGRYSDYIEQTTPHLVPPPGDIVDKQGRLRGRHRGLHHYTVGQRSGLGISAPAPLYVIELDVNSNRIVVGSKEDASREQFSVGKCIWSGIDPPSESFTAEVQVRYRHRAVECRITPTSPFATSVHVKLLSNPAILAPGQGAAFYHRNQLLGGGEILRDTDGDHQLSVI